MERPSGVVAVFLVGALCLGATAPFAAAGATAGSTPPGALATLQEFDRVEFQITVRETGDARWVFHYERTLSNDSEREQFREFAEDFNNNETQTYTDFKRQARALTAAGTNDTGREMAAENFTKDARIEGLNDNRGVVEMGFTWTNFGRLNGSHVIVADVFEGGLYLGPDQKLIFETGPELTFDTVDPQPDSMAGESLAGSDTITYVGETEFTDNRPRVAFGIEGETPTTPGTGTAAPGTTSPGTGGSPVTSPTEGTGPAGGFPWMLVVGVLVLIVGGAAAFAWRGSTGGFPGGPTRGGSGGDGGTSAAGTGGKPAISDEELLTDEDRVLSLLEDHGGRMKQVDIVDETEWSKSKVSMLLTEMEDADQINKLRVGRENIISLEGFEPDATRSPHDDG